MMIFEHTPATWVIVISVVLAVLLAGFSIWRFAPRIRGTEPAAVGLEV